MSTGCYAITFYLFTSQRTGIFKVHIMKHLVKFSCMITILGRVQLQYFKPKIHSAEILCFKSRVMQLKR